MPIQHAIWKVGAKPEPLSATRLPSEQTLEEMIVGEPSILSSEWLLIGRQDVLAGARSAAENESLVGRAVDQASSSPNRHAKA